MEVRVAGSTEKWDLLANLEFTSDRKRMSVIVRSATTNKIMLHMKGADDCMFARTRAQDPLHSSTAQHVDTFAAEGLRTLVLGQREMSESEWETFAAKKKEADATVVGRAEALASLYETIEKDLEIVGATAIEDLLQDEVPETIALLRRANIRFWMLTGDKKSTAKTIGETCKLLQPSDSGYQLLDLDGAEEAEVKRSLDAARSQRSQLLSDGSIYSIIVTGQTLKVLLEHYKQEFADLSLGASAVICCRVTPQQKADVVGIVKDTKALTVAIGDGGNDVSMIQKANVGIGILGKEGLQAARAADYSIAQFRFLKNLLLVHGRLAYHRTTFIAQYCFFKSMTYALSQGLYNIWCGYSGTPLFNSMTALGFNSFFTGLGVWFYCFDIDTPTKDYCLKHPQFYWAGQQYKKANFPVVGAFLGRGIYQAVVCCLGMVFLLGTAADDKGNPITRQTLGYAVFTSMLFGMTTQLAIHSNSIARINWTIGACLLYTRSGSTSDCCPLCD
jgi:phospholipid-translocating ATPase